LNNLVFLFNPSSWCRNSARKSLAVNCPFLASIRSHRAGRIPHNALVYKVVSETEGPVCPQPGQLLLVMLTIKTNAIGLTSRSYHAPYHILWIKKFRNEFQWSESTYLSNHRASAKIIHSFPASPQVHGFYSATGRTGFVDTYIYFMLLRKLGCMLSGCHLKMNMTKAQLRLAKTGQAFALIFSRS
jgi:hypothetical protein